MVEKRKKGKENMANKPKILYYANYFYPDKSAMSRLMTDLAIGLSENFDINVICAVPSYSGQIDNKYKEKRFNYESMDNLNIIRVRVSENDKSKKISRIKHILSYFFNAIIATYKVGKCDLVYATTAPPILGGMLGRIGKRITKAKYVYTIQDFNPEQIEAVSYSKNKILINIMRHLDSKSCKKADSVVIIGKDMQDTLDKRFGSGKIQGNYIHNWVDENDMYPLDENDNNVIKFKEKYNLDGKFIFMYLGNLGLYYDLLEILKVIEKFNNEENVVFTFVGTGAVENEMKEYCKQHEMNNVIFIEYQTGENLLYAMNSADIHMVTNAKGIKGVSVPSKIYGIMSVNKPVLAIQEKDSEVWNLVQKSKSGLLCETGKYNDLQYTIKYILDNKSDIKKKGMNARRFLLENYSKKDTLEKYKDLFTSLIKRS